jgi:hypothetical protein
MQAPLRLYAIYMIVRVHHHPSLAVSVLGFTGVLYAMVIADDSKEIGLEDYKLLDSGHS